MAIAAAAAATIATAAALMGPTGTFVTALGDGVDGLVDAGPYVLLLLLVWPVALWIAARPQRGVLLLAAFVPFDGLLTIVHTPPFAEGWKEALLLWTLLWAVLGAVGEPRRRSRLPEFVGPLMLYAGIGVASAVFVGGAQALVGLKIGYLFAGVLVVLWLRPFDARDRDRLITIMMIVAFVTALGGLAQQLLGPERVNALGYEYNKTIRFTGGFMRSFSTFDLPFAFGFFLAMVLLVGVPVAMSEPKRTRSVMFFASTPVIALALGFTFVRGAWLVLAVGLLYLAIHRYRWLLLGVPIAALSLAILPGQLASPAFQAESLNQRQLGWLDNIGQVTAEPLGSGIGATGSAAEKAREVTRLGNDVFQPDNQYFKIVYELGVVGLWFFAMVLLSSLLYVRGVERRLSGTDRALADGVVANLLGVLAACWVATYFEIFPMDFFFWMLLGVVTTCARASSSTLSL